MKKIAIVNAEATIGGVESALISMLMSIDYSNYEITLYTNIRNNPLKMDIPKSLNEKIKIVDSCKFGVRNLAKLFLRTGKYIRFLDLCFIYLTSKTKKRDTERMSFFARKLFVSEEIYDCAIAYKMGHLTTCFTLYQLQAKTKVYWVHGLLTDAPNCDPIYKEWVKQYDHLFAVSDDVVTQTIQEIPEIEGKISTFLNIMDADQIREKSTLLHDEVQTEMKSEGRLKLLTIGRFREEKNIRSIPYLCNKLREKLVSFCWYLIGYGTDEELIRDEIRKYALEDCCIILGKKENPYPYIAACDVYIQPSLHEGRSIAVVEAQILGKPVIITNYATAKSQLHDGVDGLIVPMEPGACAEAIANILKDKELLLKIAEGTKQFDYCNKDEIKKLYALIED